VPILLVCCEFLNLLFPINYQTRPSACISQIWRLSLAWPPLLLLQYFINLPAIFKCILCIKSHASTILWWHSFNSVSMLIIGEKFIKGMHGICLLLLMVFLLVGKLGIAHELLMFTRRLHNIILLWTIRRNHAVVLKIRSVMLLIEKWQSS